MKFTKTELNQINSDMQEVKNEIAELNKKMEQNYAARKCDYWCQNGGRKCSQHMVKE